MQSIASTATMVGIKSPHNITSLERYVLPLTPFTRRVCLNTSLWYWVFFIQGQGQSPRRDLQKKGHFLSFKRAGSDHLVRVHSINTDCCQY